ncbi:MAG: GGDEF domain-containing protein [Lachnospiraceae bacterium]|nr:GGDEF domain-containing protein [Lachnospiraceae bacterium]
MSFVVFNAEANIVCIAILGMLFYRNIKSIDRSERQFRFNFVLVYFMLYFCTDIVLGFLNRGGLTKTGVSVRVWNALNTVFLVTLTHSWYIFIKRNYGVLERMKLKERVTGALPMFFQWIFNIPVFVFVGKWFVDSDLDMTPFYYLCHLTIPVGYIIAASVKSFARAKDRRNFLFKKQYFIYGVYPLLVCFLGFLQIFIIGIPLFCFTTTILLLYVYLTSLDESVSIDPLTNLNNRVQLRKYVARECANKTGDRAGFYVVMMDIDRFKLINDRYGHLAGDHAIIDAATILKKSCDEFYRRTFVARYGGDEFIIILNSDKEEDVRELIEEMRNHLANFTKTANREYELNISAGFSLHTGSADEFKKSVDLADQALYVDKQNRRKLEKKEN